MNLTPRLKAQLKSTAVFALSLLVLGWLVWRAGLVLPALVGLGFAALFMLGLARRFPAVRDWLFDGASQLFKAWYWREEQGRHHEHRGVLLDITDDGRHMWIEGDSLRRALGGEARRDADDVLAARHAGRWKRGDDGTLWLRVDAVVEQLGVCPGRMLPKVLHLRRYLEREVLFPAAERRRRAAP